eukprot:s2358_g16.t1
MGCCCSGKKAVLRPKIDAGPMVGGCYSLSKHVSLMKSPSKSSETQDTLKKQAKVLLLNLEESTGVCAAFVHANQEVVLFELGLSNDVVTGRVKTCDEESSQTGWLNLQISGSPVLDAVNLLGPEVANQPPSNRFKAATWQVGRQYRALETQALAEQPASASSSASCCRFGASKMALRGSLVQLQQLQNADEGLWMQVCVQDGPNAGQIGWIQSKTDRLLVDSREQWEVERHAKPKVQEAMSPSGTIVKMADAKKNDALAAYEIPDQTDEPIEEIDRQDDADANKRQLSCGFCVCRLVPAERNHPTVIHHSAMELPASPPHRRQEKLSSAELERWLRSIYLRYNPSLLPQVPEFIEKHKDTESLLVESLATRQQDSLQAIVNKHVQDPALRELNASQTSTERGLQRWEQVHLVSALDVINEYQRSRRARVFRKLGHFGPSFRRSYKNDPRTLYSIGAGDGSHIKGANAACNSLPEEEVRSMCGICRDILSHPQLFPARNPQSFMKSIADVYDHLQWQLQEVLEKDRSCAELAQRILSMSRNLVTDTITYLLFGAQEVPVALAVLRNPAQGLPSMEVVKLWQSLPNEGHPMPHRKDPALQKLMGEAWQSHVGMLVAALLRAPWCVRLFAGADAESSTRLLALEDGKDFQLPSLQSLLKEAERCFDAGYFKGSGLVGALRQDEKQRSKWIQALMITSDIMYLLGEVMVQFHRISDGLGDFGMIRVSPWLHPVLDRDKL